jgi:hypothetical protein
MRRRLRQQHHSLLLLLNIELRSMSLVTVLTGLTGWNMLVLLHISPLLLDNMYPPMLVLVLMMLILN